MIGSIVCNSVSLTLARRSSIRVRITHQPGSISNQRCDVDLVLVSTEGHKAIDVFHITKSGRKLSDTDQSELAADMHRMLDGDR